MFNARHLKNKSRKEKTALKFPLTVANMGSILADLNEHFYSAVELFNSADTGHTCASQARGFVPHNGEHFLVSDNILHDFESLSSPPLSGCM